MNLRYERLKREVQERVLINGGGTAKDADRIMRKSFQEVLDQLHKEWDLYYDNDRHVQAFDKMRDINTLKGMIVEYETRQHDQARTSIQYPSVSEILDDIKK